MRTAISCYREIHIPSAGYGTYFNAVDTRFRHRMLNDGVPAVGCTIIVLRDKRAVRAIEHQEGIEIIYRLTGTITRRIGLDRERVTGLHDHMTDGTLPPAGPCHRLLQKLVGRSRSKVIVVAIHVSRTQPDTASLLRCSIGHCYLITHVGQSDPTLVQPGIRILDIGLHVEVAQALSNGMGCIYDVDCAFIVRVIVNRGVYRHNGINIIHGDSGGLAGCVDQPTGPHDTSAGLHPLTQYGCQRGQVRLIRLYPVGDYHNVIRIQFLQRINLRPRDESRRKRE